MGESPESAGAEDQPAIVRAVKRVVGFVWSNWLVLGFGLACILGYFFPRMLIGALSFFGDVRVANPP